VPHAALAPPTEGQPVHVARAGAPLAAAAVALAPAPAPPAPAADHAPVLPELATVQQDWPAVLEALRTENGLLAHVLAEAQPVALQEGELHLAFPLAASFLKRKAEDAAYREALASAVHSVCGLRLRPCYELRDIEPAANGVAANGAGATPEELMERLMAEFDAELVQDHDTEGA
jgi:hypothetical protein